MAKIEASDSVIFGVSMDSPAANGVFAKQIGVTFPLLSDMRGIVEEKYGILQPVREMAGYPMQFAQRTTFVIDKQGVIRKIQFGTEAINPSTAVSMCLNLHRGK